MSVSFTPSAKRRNLQKMKIDYNLEKSSLQNTMNKRRIESAKISFPISNHNYFSSGKNKYTFNENSKNNTTSTKIERPIWKYSYFLDKNDILNIRNESEIRNLLNSYKDIDNKPKPLVYSWTKPRMIKIIENNRIIEEEVKSSFWKYSYIFQNDIIKPPGKLLKLMVNQLTSGYGNEFSYMNINKSGTNDDNNNFRNKIFHDKHWRHPGVYRYKKNEYEPIKIKRGK